MLAIVSNAQVIFSEPFNEATGSITGSDNTGGVTWNTSCPTCTPTGDYFEVKSNVLECDDTNGPATWTTGSINTAICTNGLTLAMDINLAAATNPFEECGAGCGCTCVDWISVEYNCGGSGFVPLSSVQGGTCSQTCSGGTYILLGALTSGTSYNFSTCLPACNSLVLRISLQTWAGGEKYQIDNVTVSCSSCALPIELTSFNAKYKNNVVELDWATSAEINNDYFTVERSADGIHFEPVSVVKGAGNSHETRSYKDYDLKPLDLDVAYYRLKQTDYDHTFTYSKMVAVGKGKLNDYDFSIIPNPSESGIFTISSNQNETSENTVEILDYTGRLISENVLETNSSTIDLSSYSKGLYIVRITSGDKIINHKIIYN
ncbi:MAG: T9SS type A sorting domain-containing protein [Bacteroidia bacterium]|nr:T9SS type A sorting domain-containing protein [Bacteroidia bacterium]